MRRVLITTCFVAACTAAAPEPQPGLAPQLPPPPAPTAQASVTPEPAPTAAPPTPKEEGTPYFDARVMAEEVPLLPSGVDWVEGQDLDPALDRVRAAKPDLTVSGLGIANPLETEGLRTK